MDLHYRLMRQTINIAVSKTIEDMRSNPKRSIRNLFDLGLLFSQSKNQKWVFNTAKNAISDANNPYYKLVSRMIADVDIHTIKTVGINLGYISLLYGANKLRKLQSAMNCSLPWVLIFNASRNVPGFFSRTEAFIQKARELGIYSYVFCPQKIEEIAIICKIAERFEECVFVIKTLPELITVHSTEWIRRVHNIVISVHVSDFVISSDRYITAFRILRDNHCLYGFHTDYNESSMKVVTASEFISSAISLGNIFGMYIPQKGIIDSCQNAMHTFVCGERSATGLPLLTFEWLGDMRFISEILKANGGYMVVHSADDHLLPIQQT